MWIPVSASTASKAAVNCPARSRTRNRKSAARSVAEVGDEVAGLLGGPGAVGVGGGAKDVDVARVDLDHEEHVDPLQRDRAVDVEEVAGQHRGGLGAEELLPGCSVRSGRGWRYPELFEDASDCGGADSAPDLQ